MPSVADLVEPELLAERAGQYLVRAADVLRASGRVRLVTFTPLRVDAEVDDGGTRHVELAAARDEVRVTCDCGSANDDGWCPHAVAAAFETWERAPKRRSG